MVVRIDGSAFTGGGGLLRAALGLSMLTGEPLAMQNVRAGREPPGLSYQHLAAIKLAAAMSSAAVEGAELRSTKILFMPTALEAGTYELDIGTAGSIPLALQSAILAAAFSGKRFSFHLRGGTDVPHAPSADYLREVFAPAIRSLAKVTVEVAERGFAPKGDGRMIVKVASDYSSLARIAPLNFATPSAPAKLEFRIVSTTQGYDGVREHLLLAGRSIGVPTSASVGYAKAASPGVASTIIVHQSQPIARAIGSSSLETHGLAQSLFAEAKRILELPCDEHLADQLVPYVARHGGAIQAPISEHVRAAIHVSEAFLPGRLDVDEANGIIVGRGEER